MKNVLIVFAIAVLLGQGGADASKLSDIVGRMQPHTFMPLTPNDLTYEMTHYGPTMDVVWAYASDVHWEPLSRQLMFLGSAHGTGSKFVVYDEATNHWRDEPTCRNPQQIDGSNRFGHAYDMRTVDTKRGIYWIHTYNGGKIFRFHPQDSTWDSLVPTGTWDATNMNSIEYFPDIDKIIAYSGTDGSIRSIDPDSTVFRYIGNLGHADGFEVCIDYNPYYHCMVLGGSDGGIKPLYTLDTNLQLNLLTTPPVQVGCIFNEMDCDPGTGDILVFTGTNFNVYNFGTGQWTIQALSPASLANLTMTGVNCIMGTIPEYNCHVILNVTSYSVLLYKHSEGGISRTEAPALRPLSGLNLGASPNPFHGGARITAQGLRGSGTFRIHGLDGKLVYSSRIESAAGRAVISWPGTDNAGRRVNDGAYIGTVTDANGLTASVRLTVLR